MYEKSKLSFKNKAIFGYNFKNSIDECFCRVSKMLFSGKINPDGMISEERSDAFRKSELWSYIYYIYHYNNSDVDEFKAMKTKKTGLASAIMFYNVVNTVSERESYDLSSSFDEAKPFSTLTLIKFLNYIIIDNENELVNPIFDYLKVMMDKKILTNMEGIKLVTNKNGQNGKFDILMGNAVKNANVKIGLQRAGRKK